VVWGLETQTIPISFPKADLCKTANKGRRTPPINRDSSRILVKHPTNNPSIKRGAHHKIYKNMVVTNKLLFENCGPLLTMLLVLTFAACEGHDAECFGQYTPSGNTIDPFSLHILISGENRESKRYERSRIGQEFDGTGEKISRHIFPMPHPHGFLQLNDSPDSMIASSAHCAGDNRVSVMGAIHLFLEQGSIRKFEVTISINTQNQSIYDENTQPNNNGELKRNIYYQLLVKALRRGQPYHLILLVCKTKIDSFRFHGNYCGPGWSEGKYQSSVDGTLEPIDNFDKACQKHDKQYYYSKDDSDRQKADQEFLNDLENIQGIKPYLAKKAIQLQMGIRGKKAKTGKVNTNKTGTQPMAKKKAEAVIKRLNKRAAAMEKQQAMFKSVPVGVSYGNRSRAITGSSSQGNVFVGSDFLSNLKTGSIGNSAGDNIYKIDLAPGAIPNSKLLLFTQMYQKYTFMEAWVEYTPQCPTSTSGSVVGFFSPDPDDGDIVGMENVRWATSTPGNEKHSVFLRAKYMYKGPAKNQAKLFTDRAGTELRFNTQGTFRLIAETSLPANVEIGSLTLHYKIKFYKPSTRINTATNYALLHNGSGADSDHLWGNPITNAVIDSNNAFKIQPLDRGFSLPNAALGDYYGITIGFSSTSTSMSGMTLTGLAQVSEWSKTYAISTDFIYYAIVQVTSIAVPPGIVWVGISLGASIRNNIMAFKLVNAAPAAVKKDKLALMAKENDELKQEVSCLQSDLISVKQALRKLNVVV